MTICEKCKKDISARGFHNHIKFCDGVKPESIVEDKKIKEIDEEIAEEIVEEDIEEVDQERIEEASNETKTKTIGFAVFVFLCAVIIFGLHILKTGTIPLFGDKKNE